MASDLARRNYMDKNLESVQNKSELDFEHFVRRDKDSGANEVELILYEQYDACKEIENNQQKIKDNHNTIQELGNNLQNYLDKKKRYLKEVDDKNHKNFGVISNRIYGGYLPYKANLSSDGIDLSSDYKFCRSIAKDCTILIIFSLILSFINLFLGGRIGFGWLVWVAGLIILVILGIYSVSIISNRYQLLLKIPKRKNGVLLYGKQEYERLSLPTTTAIKIIVTISTFFAMSVLIFNLVQAGGNVDWIVLLVANLFLCIATIRLWCMKSREQCLQDRKESEARIQKEKEIANENKQNEIVNFANEYKKMFENATKKMQELSEESQICQKKIYIQYFTLEQLNKQGGLSRHFWYSNAVALFIDFFQKGRIDTLKEGVQIFEQNKDDDKRINKIDKRLQQGNQIMRELANDIQKQNLTLTNIEEKMEQANSIARENLDTAQENNQLAYDTMVATQLNAVATNQIAEELSKGLTISY